MTHQEQVIIDSDIKLIEDALYDVYHFMQNRGYFTSPTDEMNKMENMLIQSRVRIGDIKRMNAEAKAMYEVLNKIVIATDPLAYNPLHKSIMFEAKQIINRINKMS